MHSWFGHSPVQGEALQFSGWVFTRLGFQPAPVLCIEQSLGSARWGAGPENGPTQAPQHQLIDFCAFRIASWERQFPCFSLFSLPPIVFPSVSLFGGNYTIIWISWSAIEEQRTQLSAFFFAVSRIICSFKEKNRQRSSALLIWRSSLLTSHRLKRFLGCISSDRGCLILLSKQRQL